MVVPEMQRMTMMVFRRPNLSDVAPQMNRPAALPMEISMIAEVAIVSESPAWAARILPKGNDHQSGHGPDQQDDGQGIELGRPINMAEGG